MENSGKEGKIEETSVESIENNDTIASDKDTLIKEIEQAMEELEQTDNPENPADVSQDTPTAADDGATNGEEGKETSPDTSSAIDDALVERAVKAGLSIADARSFTSGEVLSRIVDSLEGKAKPDAQNKDGGDDPSTPNARQDDSALPPELSEDDGYDPGLVAAFNGMRNMLQKQNEIIASFSNERAAKERDSYFDSLVDTLDEPVRKGMDNSSRKRLRDQFDVLVSGYASLGMEKNIADVFKEAAKIALGEDIAKAAADRKAKALEGRRNLAIARPGGEGGARAAKGGEGGDDAELIALLNQKFGG